MPIDGEPVIRVALRFAADGQPLRENPPPDVTLIERLDDRDGRASRQQEIDERLARVERPRFTERRRVSGQPLERLSIDDGVALRSQRSGAQRDGRVALHRRVGREMHLAVAQHDTGSKLAVTSNDATERTAEG